MSFITNPAFMRHLLPLLMFFSLPLYGQSWYLKRAISWEHAVTPEKTMSFDEIISFANSDYENNNALLPRYFENIAWHAENPSVTIRFFKAEYQQVPADDEARQKLSELTDSIRIQSHISTAAGRPFLQIALVPFRKNPSTGITERLTSFVLQIESVPLPVKSSALTGKKKTAGTEKSMLAYGNWFKIKVPETGIYKLTYGQLSSIGLSEPANVKVYGWGGACLPENSTLGEQDDLPEVPVYMNKGPDGIFNAGDYILFYGTGPVTWSYSAVDTLFLHDLNPYSDYGYYFLSSDFGPSAEPAAEPAATGDVTRTTDSYDIRAYHEVDELNLLKMSGDQKGSGREWYGEDFATTPQRTFDFIFPGLITDEEMRFKTNVLGRSKDSTEFVISANNKTLATLKIRPTNLSDYTATYAYTAEPLLHFMPSGETVQLKYRFIKPDNESEGYLDYISIMGRARLELDGSLVMFRESRGTGTSSVTHFSLGNAKQDTRVWDVTDVGDIRKITGTTEGSNLSFTVNTPDIREFIAFDPAGTFPAPLYQGEDLGRVENQDLHGENQPDYIIVSYSGFLNYANELAAYRREHNQLNILVVTPEQAYNEFSSGRPDPTAIRNMMRYYYKRSGGDPAKMPKYLLLFGDGSYIYKGKIEKSGNYVPAYQSLNSLSPTASYVSDDYFAILDDGEDMYYGLLDAGVGRLPVHDTIQARRMIDKIKGYEKQERMGEWRNNLCFIGDDEDYNTHFNQSNELALNVEARYPYFNVNKIFLDAYKQVSTPVGQRYPDVNRAINDQVARGALIINYTGHGGTEGLAHERILEKEDIMSWSNSGKLPLFMTATCEFSRFDDPGISSAGEDVLLYGMGGGIALLTTTRLVYSGPNNVLNEHFYEVVFEKDSMGMNYSLGEVMEYTKNETGFGINKRNFALLGDPAMRLTYPFYHVATDSIDHKPVEAGADTLSALKKVAVSGHLEDNTGGLLTTFNGVIYPVVFDKPSVQTTLANDGGEKKTFTLRNNIIYRGKASVKNGLFSFEFYVPKDISYAVGGGKLSYYASDSVTDAAGAFLNFKVGGSSADPEADVGGPDIDIYMNNEYFKPDGITDSNPVLYVKVFDEHGINTAGNGIGHDITGILDGNTKNILVLNEYYQAGLNNFRSGTIEYPLSKLSNGRHSIAVKVWDIYNNSNEDSLGFIVVTSEDMILDNLLSFPNPFSESTSLSFEHNDPGANLDITIDIFNLAGRLMKTIKTKEYNSGFRSKPIEWNGYDESGNKSRQGMYIYRIHVRSSDGKEATSSGKLIIVR